MPVGTDVDLGHAVLDGDPGPPKGVQQPSHIFSAHVYCG